MCLMPAMVQTARAAGNVVNTVTTSEQLSKTSTVYVGEVVVDGVSEIKYLYSGNVSSKAIRDNLLDCLNGMADGDYAALFLTNWPDPYSAPPQKFAFCTNSEYAAAMDENWSNAQYVGSLYFADKTVASEINSNLYDINNGFKAALDAQTEFRIENIDNRIDAEKCIVFYFDVNSTDNVYYTVENGQVVKHVDSYVVYSAEATTVIYTKVELESAQGSNTLLMANADDEGNYWATYYNGQASMSADDNTTVYTAKVNADGSKVILTEVTDKIIPAGNAVVMKSLHDKITLTATDAAGTLPDNELQGQPEPFNTPDNLYALVKGTHGLGFYHYPETTQFPAQNAYLIISGGNVREYVPFSDGTTGILTVQPADDESAPLYDLTGRKAAAQPRPGIYVRNGKKVAIK